MALKKVELSKNSLLAIQNQGIQLNELSNDEFNEKINSLIIAGVNKLPISSENYLLLENILKFATSLDKSDEIQANLKIKLKELHKDLLEAL